MTIAKLNDLGQDIFEKRYAYPGETKWSERAKVIAKAAASAESDDEKEKYEKKFYDAISSGDLIPGGRIIYGSGRNAGKHNLLNCYVIIPEDSVISIGKTIDDMYKISCAGGGIGFNFSKIRPKGDDIQNNKHSAPGAISVMRMINEIGCHVRSGGSRRTALMGILNITHPDLLEFLHVKLDKGELNNFNISVAITNDFINACELGEDWYFTFNNKNYYVYELIRTSEDGSSDTINVVALDEEDATERALQHHRKGFTDTFSMMGKVDLKAKDLWNKIWTNSVESGDPGIYNIDLANSYTNVSYFESLDSTNPCGEISLPSYGNCCLGNVNLSNMVTDGEVDWKRLARTVRSGVRFLDNILTINHFPTKTCEEVAQRSRRIGLGVTGLHYMLIKLGILYGSEKCLEFLDRLFTTIRDEAYKESVYTARDKGSFVEFDSTAYLSQDFAKTLPARIRMLIKQHGIRNAVMLTIPPCGTISMLMGVSSGIEPIFAPVYLRRYRDGNVNKKVVVVDPLFDEFVKENKPLDNFVGAYDVTPEEHIRVQVTIQRYMDSCISKTINLPETFEASDLADTALEYSHYLKGLTVYKAGSKGEEPLTAMSVDDYLNKPQVDEVEKAVADGMACSIAGGDCG